MRKISPFSVFKELESSDVLFRVFFIDSLGNKNYSKWTTISSKTYAAGKHVYQQYGLLELIKNFCLKEYIRYNEMVFKSPVGIEIFDKRINKINLVSNKCADENIKLFANKLILYIAYHKSIVVSLRVPYKIISLIQSGSEWDRCEIDSYLPSLVVPDKIEINSILRLYVRSKIKSYLIYRDFVMNLGGERLARNGELLNDFHRKLIVDFLNPRKIESELETKRLRRTWVRISESEKEKLIDILIKNINSEITKDTILESHSNGMSLVSQLMSPGYEFSITPDQLEMGFFVRKPESVIKLKNSEHYSKSGYCTSCECNPCECSDPKYSSIDDINITN